MIEKFDYLVVGSGLAGSVLAERLASDGKKILIVERRDHFGGNCYDEYNEDGVLIHRYGSHLYHTSSKEIFDYTSKFTEWLPYEHTVLASVDGMLLPLPINLDTVNQLYGLNLTSFELEEFFASKAESCEIVKTSEDVIVSKIGRDLYEKFFKSYTKLQWNLDPSQLDSSVTARVPTRTTRDNRYFTDSYQAQPKHGYTAMFRKMLSNENIKIMLNTSFEDVKELIPYDKLIYTGTIDSFYGYRFGRLPYRSLNFVFETYDKESYQNAPVVNYPNEHPYTRISEFKKMTHQKHDKTTIMYEFPCDNDDEPYYPIPRPENKELFRKYKELADKEDNVIFCGRLATYQYLNIDQAIGQALATYGKIVGKHWKEVAK